MSAADVAAVDASLPIVRDPGLVSVEIGDETLDGRWVLCLRAELLEEADGAGDFALPELADEAA